MQECNTKMLASWAAAASCPAGQPRNSISHGYHQGFANWLVALLITLIFKGFFFLALWQNFPLQFSIWYIREVLASPRPRRRLLQGCGTVQHWGPAPRAALTWFPAWLRNSSPKYSFSARLRWLQVRLNSPFPQDFC